MFNIGMSEMAIIAALALILIGPKQLPEVARTLGRFLNELKRSASVFTDEIKSQVHIDTRMIRQQPPDPPSEEHHAKIYESSSEYAAEKKAEPTDQERSASDSHSVETTESIPLVPKDPSDEKKS